MDWQRRIEREGWADKLVDDVVEECLRFARYKKEDWDYWDTPREFIEKGFTGDCEDIAIFIMGTFKRLSYPHNMRILVVRTLLGDHAVFKIEMPVTGKWRQYESVPKPLIRIDQFFYRPMVEFDQHQIVYLQR